MMKEVDREGGALTSDDEEEEEGDSQNLIPQNQPTKSRSFSSFNIAQDAFTSSVYRRFRGSSITSKFCKKRYLLSISILVLLCIFIYFSVSGNSGSMWNVKFAGSESDQMRQSELRALYLLKQQHLGLLSLLNRTLGNSGIVGSNSTVNNNTAFSVSSSLDFEELKSVLYKDILLNNDIQQILLSSHKTGEVSEVGITTSEVMDIDICKKVNPNFSERRTVEWNPRSDKYLLAICTSGQMSNHLICLEKHMFFAALLNRVLIIPSPKVDYEFHRVLDIEHINECIGRKVVITFDEFYEMKGKKDLKINKFLCYFSKPDYCYLDDKLVNKLKRLGFSVPKLESPWEDDVAKPKKRTVKDVQENFASDEEVVAVGDVFFANVEKEWVMQPGGPIAHRCKTLIEPSRLILLTAQRFIQTFLGKDYVSLHFRRHGFLKFCNAKKPSCFYPVPQAADCIKYVVEKANAPVIYLSTDAAESETGLLQSLMVIDGKPVPLIKRPPRNSAEKWDALLYRHGLQDDSQVEAMLDKTICALSSVFIGSSGSTFTEDILRLRKDWGSASVCDEYICQRELPNFIADDDGTEHEH